MLLVPFTFPNSVQFYIFRNSVILKEIINAVHPNVHLFTNGSVTMNQKIKCIDK